MAQPQYPISSFTTDDLIRAIAPIFFVLESFKSKNNDWTSVESQGHFARLVESHRNEFGPYDTYLKSLVRLYVSRVEAGDNEVEDEVLLSLILHFSLTKDPVVPDPLESCYISFRIPPSDDCCSSTMLRLRVFPRHNDVALKLWEAGACLAEYLMQNPEHVAGKECAELGSGIGLSGIVLAGCCHPASFHMTDYTEAGLRNLQHNIKVNQEWLRQRMDDACRLQERITQGYLDWEEYAAESALSTFDVEQASSNDALCNTQVLLAADVVYGMAMISCLAQTVHRFLTSGEGTTKVAIFATTLRNKKTFTALEQHLGDHRIECDYVDSEALESMPYIFPVYNVQPRSDVRICFMRLAKGERS